MTRLQAIRTSLSCALIVLSMGVGPALTSAKDKARGGKDSNAAVNAQAAAKGDVLLETLLTELDRSKAKLKMDGVQAPYYIEYRVHDVDEFDAEAAFGALREDQRNHIRVLRVVVRIGDYKQDSYYNQGVGRASILSIDNDPVALRREIWLLTDDVYKAAADAYAEKLSALKQYSADPDPVNDFAKAPVVTSVEPTVQLKVDGPAWDQTLQQMTNLFREYPDIQYLSASARFNATNEYFVNSEGTVTRNGATYASVAVNGSTQAADGMRLNRNPFWTEERAEDLPKPQALVQETKTMLDTLKALREAPIVEESYRGPVLFAPDAADDVLATLIAGNVVGRKPPLGKPNRTTGSFATSYKTRILPKFISIIDDPTLREFQGKLLLGHYDVDSEGVKAQEVTIVDAGTLTNYLLSRQPIRDFAVSNGHGRSGPGNPPMPSTATLILKTSEPMSPAELKKKATEMAADQSKPYAYRVDTLGAAAAPRLLYRVYVNDGHEELGPRSSFQRTRRSRSAQRPKRRRK